MKPRVLNAEPLGYSPLAAGRLAERAQLDMLALDRPGLLAAIGGYEGLIVRLGHRVDEELLARGGRLRFVATATTGLDHVDLAAARRRGVAVLSLRDEQDFLQTVTSTAELAFGLLLALARHLLPAARAVRQGRWDRDEFRGTELRRGTLAVIGVGRLGSMMCAYGKAFGMRVIGVDPQRAVMPDGVEAMPLADALPLADAVSVHAKYARGEAAILGRAQLALMKPGALLVNTARGGCIDEEALLAALETGAIGGAALDVLAQETAAGFPGREKLLRYAARHDNLLLTPHIGGATHQAMAATELFMAERIIAHLDADG